MIQVLFDHQLLSRAFLEINRAMRVFWLSNLSNCDVMQVVCCEGNAGFYEVGSCATPLDAGFSVLGWNHPGFAGSTVSTLYDQYYVFTRVL